MRFCIAIPSLTRRRFAAAAWIRLAADSFCVRTLVSQFNTQRLIRFCALYSLLNAAAAFSRINCLLRSLAFLPRNTF